MSTEEKEMTLEDVFSRETREPAAGVTGEEVKQEPKEQPKEAKADATPGEEKKPDAGEDVELTEAQEAALPPHEKGWYRSMKAERTKRQEEERKRSELETSFRAEMEAIKAQNQQLLQHVLASRTPTPETPRPAEPPKSFWDDPEGFLEAKLQGVTGEVTNAKQLAQRVRLDTLETMARSRHADYDEGYNVFAAAVQANPAILQAILQQNDPAEAAYQYGKQLSETRKLHEAGGLSAYEQKLRAQWEEEARKAAEAAPVEQAIQRNLPKSVGSMRATGGMSTKEFVPTDFKNIFHQT